MVSSSEYMMLAIGGIIISGTLCLSIIMQRKSLQRQTLRDVRRQFEGVPIRAVNPRAYFCGMERAWDGQWHGRGVLMLTEETLYFRLWNRNLDLSIPVKRMFSVDACSQESRKLLRCGQLRITYRSVDDQLRTCAWRVKKPHEWARTLREVLERNIQNGKAQEEHLSSNENAP